MVDFFSLCFYSVVSNIFTFSWIKFTHLFYEKYRLSHRIKSILNSTNSKRASIEMARRESLRLKAKMRQFDEQQEEPIFQLIDDCCYAIFDFLSLENLCSFGQTCKWAQRVAADFYRRNLSTIVWTNSSDAFYLNNTQFLRIEGRPSEPFRQIEKHCSQPIKYISLNQTTISPAKVNYLKKILRTVEEVVILHCEISGDFYKKFLKFCENLKKLSIGNNPSDHILIGDDNGWLTRKYPTLEHLEVTSKPSGNTVEALKIFFVKNPNVRSFGYAWDGFLKYQFRDTDIHLDELSVLISHPISKQLNALHERTVFQRLHCLTLSISHQMTFMNGLDKLCVHKWDGTKYGNLSSILVSIKELCILEIIDGSNMETIARDLVNLECLYLVNSTREECLSFIRHSAKLMEIRITAWRSSNSNVLNLATWNKEREKLAGARKVKFYVEEEVYLATKWATNNTNLSLIELKRTTFDDLYWF